MRFVCLGCGRCCRREGAAFLLPEVMAAMACRFDLEPLDFRRRFTTNRWRYPSLGSRHDGRCVMLNGESRCQVYDLRPVHCRTWPFWPETLITSEAWMVAARSCPGMNEGPVVDREIIVQILSLHRTFFDRLAACQP